MQESNNIEPSCDQDRERNYAMAIVRPMLQRISREGLLPPPQRDGTRMVLSILCSQGLKRTQRHNRISNDLNDLSCRDFLDRIAERVASMEGASRIVDMESLSPFLFDALIDELAQSLKHDKRSSQTDKCR